MTNLSKKLVLFLGIGLFVLILLSPFLGLFFTTTYSPKENQLPNKNFQSPNQNLHQLNENLYPKSVDQILQSFKYGQQDISETYSLVCNSNLIIVGTRGETTPNVFVVSNSDESGMEISTSSEDYVKNVSEFNNDNIFIIGNRKQGEQNSVFFFSLSSSDFSMLYSDKEIVIEEDCWFKQMLSLPNGNFLILIKSLNNTKSALHLFEINPSSGTIVNQENFPNSGSNVLAEIDLGSLDYIHIYNSGQILLIGQNTSASDAGVFLTSGNFGTSWNNYSISGNVEFWGLTVDQNEDLSLALLRDNTQSGKDDLDIVKFSQSFSLKSNYTFSSPSQSYKVIKFQINSGSSSNLPFLVYEIWGSPSNPGLGFCFIDENVVLQQHEETPSDTHSYRVGDLTFLSNGDVCFAIFEIYSEIADITIYRVGRTNNPNFAITDQSFTQFADSKVIGESEDENSVYISIYDFGKSGILTLNKDLNSKVGEFYLDSEITCRAKYYEEAGISYFLMFGFQGDYFNYQANAILLLYSLNGNKLASIIREEDNSYSEVWDWISIENGIIYLSGSNVQSSSTLFSLIGGIIGFQEFNSPYKKCSNIAIYGLDSINTYVENGFINGSGTQNDPYILDSLIIDGNDQDTKSYEPGILINYYAYYVIQNCIISNLGNGDQYLAGIEISNIDFYKIQNTTVTQCLNGIKISNGDNGTIYNNTIENCQNTGIMLTQSQIEDNGSNGNKISNNVIRHITNCGDYWQGNGIYVFKGSWNIIEHNIITENCNYGVYLDNCWVDCSNALVYNTMVQDNDLSGNRLPYNSELDTDFGNVFKNNIGAEDFPSSDAFGIPGFSTGLLMIFGILCVIALIPKINSHKKKF
ncbi:MAG: right-handed parallel beta-helix repeat-containing protein [Promethearchaeota archaeon]